MEEHLEIRKIRTTEELIGDDVSGVYCCQKLITKKLSGTKTYCIISLSDKTGTITGSVLSSRWQNDFVGKAVYISGIISLYKGNPSLDVYDMSVFHTNTSSADVKELPDSVRDSLVCEINRKQVITQFQNLRNIINGYPTDYQELALKILTKEPAEKMGSQPYSLSCFAYNGGLLEHCVYLQELAASMSRVEIPSGAYEQVTPDWMIIKAALLFSDICRIDRFSSFPVGAEDRLKKGGTYLAKTYNELQKNQELPVEQIIHCIQVLCFEAEPLTQEAELCKVLTAMGVSMAAYSFAEFSLSTRVNGHIYERGE